MIAIAQYPDNFSHYHGDDHLTRILEINEELPSVNTRDPQAIDIIAMLLWLDSKYDLDHNNQIVFEIWKAGLWVLTDFHINVTFCDPVKAAAARQLSHAWDDMQIEEWHRDRAQREDMLIKMLYDTDSTVLFVPPEFKIDPRRRLYVIPSILANTSRSIRVKRVPVTPGANIAYTVRPDGTRVPVP